MKYLIIFSLIVVQLGSLSWAEEYLRDVPKGHWAADAVYQLIKMGVTSGYPDGTFRGKKDISRFEAAVLLSKFAAYFGQAQAVKRKLVAELRAETALLKYQRQKLAGQDKLKGRLLARGRASSIVPRGGKLDYRLKLSWLKRFGENSNLRVNLDTLDTGYNITGQRLPVSQLLGLENRFTRGSWAYSLSFGPGPLVHRETSGFFPSEDCTIYERPRTGITAARRFNKLSVSGSYLARQQATSGKVEVNELTLGLKYKFGRLALGFQPRYLFVIDGQHDALAQAWLNYQPQSEYLTQLLWAVGDFRAGTSGMYAKATQKVIDPFKTGTVVVLSLAKVGTQYAPDFLNDFEFLKLNNFDRVVRAGTFDLGLKIRQTLTKQLAAEWLSDYVTDAGYHYGAAYPETYFIWQLAFNYRLSSGLDLSAFYKSYNVPSGLAQYAQTVPTISEIIGCGLSCSF